MKKKFLTEWKEFKIFMRCVPAWVAAAFCLSVFAMNLLANKSISTGADWLALDCGITVSWLSFLAMDITTKHFGPKAATELSLFALILSFLFCFIFFLSSLISGMWGEAYVDGYEDIINTALNNTFGGTWYVLFGSAFAFVVSAVVNNTLNYAVGKAFRKNPDGFFAYASRTYISTAVAQFTDNMVFAFAVSRIFFGWSLLQCVTCSLIGMAAELLSEVVFSPIGFAVCKKWKRGGVGAEYFSFKGEL